MMQRDAALDAFNTLRLPATAQYLAMPRTVAEVRIAIEQARTLGAPITVLGGGSNVVLLSRIPGYVIVPRLADIRLERRDGKAFVTAGAGVVWHELVRFCLGQGLAGVENLALIPGSVGGAPIQNIGAYGVEVERCFHSLAAVSCGDGASVEMDARQCAFGYRDSVFKHARGSGLIITSVTLMLDGNDAPRTNYPDVRNQVAAMGNGRITPVLVAEAVIRVRRRKLPDVRHVPNAGSFFKNPVLTDAGLEKLLSRLADIPTYAAANGTKVAAARLIEAAGWKGRTAGAAGVWHRQPLVLINRGGARGADMLRLGRMIQDDVAERFGVNLEMEPIVLGEDG
jgi:UDP-N-acetylmuramate dehydrogenase